MTTTKVKPVPATATPVLETSKGMELERVPVTPMVTENDPLLGFELVKADEGQEYFTVEGMQVKLYVNRTKQREYWESGKILLSEWFPAGCPLTGAQKKELSRTFKVMTVGFHAPTIEQRKAAALAWTGKNENDAVKLLEKIATGLVSSGPYDLNKKAYRTSKQIAAEVLASLSNKK